ncbi:MPV17 [Acrasis kona]|uniref:MPV17 n=1 Tax=Acrasis kona TaxID=1008807 RepID=A0AAW2ZK92_9EUKA
MVKRLWRMYNHALSTRPLLTNTVTASTLFLAGDVLCQTIERRTKRIEAEEKGTEAILEWDYMRMLRMTTFGAVFFGPSSHLWYMWLDKFFVRASKEARDLPLRDFKSMSDFVKHSKLKLTLKKIALDEGFYSPFCIAALFVFVSTLEGQNLEYIKDKFRYQFIEAYKMDLAIWPAAQFVNFFFLPAAYRVLYISFICIFWNAYLSQVQNTSAH